MNYPHIKRFNFTWACDGGAWLEDDKGYVNWEPWSVIRHHMGQHWIDAQRAKQGWMTGCWVTCNEAKTLNA